MKIERKPKQWIALIVILVSLSVISCGNSDRNTLQIYNATKETIDIKTNYLDHNSVLPGTYCEIYYETSYSLHHIINGFNTVSIYHKGICVKTWDNPTLLSCDDPEHHSFFNLESWEKRPGENENERVRYIFTITEEDLIKKE